MKPSLSVVIMSQVEKLVWQPALTLHLPPKSPILGDFEIYDYPRWETFRRWLEHNKAVPSVTGQQLKLSLSAVIMSWVEKLF